MRAGCRQVVVVFEVAGSDTLETGFGAVWLLVRVLYERHVLIRVSDEL